MKELKNREDVIDMIAGEMRGLDMQALDFQVDIYLYIDEDGVGMVDTFSNPGGNSWRDDDHITVCINGPHYDDYWDGIEDFFEEGNNRGWDDLSDDQKDELLPDICDYREQAIHYLDMALRDYEG